MFGLNMFYIILSILKKCYKKAASLIYIYVPGMLTVPALITPPPHTVITHSQAYSTKTVL